MIRRENHPEEDCVYYGVAYRLRERRHIVLGGVVTPIDDHGHCGNLHPGKAVRWHPYRDEKGRRWALLCPLSLGQTEIPEAA